MSDVKHKIWAGAKTVVDIDGALIIKKNPPFTFDRTDITFDTIIRTFDETP